MKTTIPELKSVTIRDMPAMLWQQFAGACKSRGKTISEVLSEIIRAWIVSSKEKE